jgi:hypothetical protein
MSYQDFADDQRGGELLLKRNRIAIGVGVAVVVVGTVGVLGRRCTAK